MIRTARGYFSYRITAQDGDIGSVVDLYFDDERWVIRYLIVDTGTWLPGRKVLISPRAVTEVDATHKRVHLSLTRDQVKNAPGIDHALPVSRQQEMQHNQYYGWPDYWVGGNLWGGWPTPALVPPGNVAPVPTPRSETMSRPEDPARLGTGVDRHLRSVTEVLDYTIVAQDGDLGRVEDFLVDSSDWSIGKIVVDTTVWFGGEVAVEPERIKRVGWDEKTAKVDLTRAEVKESPPVDLSEFGHR